MGYGRIDRGSRLALGIQPTRNWRALDFSKQQLLWPQP
jgi:hypothetical protein